MLPREMCAMCSLLPGDDKLAFSVFWEISPEAEVVSHHFTRSVINSCTKLAYEHAQVNCYWSKAYKGMHMHCYHPELQEIFLCTLEDCFNYVIFVLCTSLHHLSHPKFH